MRDRAHERLVRILDVAEHHVEVALVDRQVDRLADRAAGMVQRRALVGQLHQIAEILDGCIAPPLVQAAIERRTVNRSEHQIGSADGHRALRVARMLHELRRGAGDQRAKQAAGEAHPLALHVGARVLEERQCLLVLDDVDADLFQDGLGVLLDQRKALFAQHLEGREPSGDELVLLCGAGAPFLAPRLSTATAATPAAAARLHSFLAFCSVFHRTALPAPSDAAVTGTINPPHRAE